MKWPHLKFRRSVDMNKPEEPEDLKNARRQLRQVRSRWPEVNALVGKLGNLGDENHFTELISEAMQGGRE